MPVRQPAAPAPEETRPTRVVSVVERANRVAAMLDRWAAEDAGDEPDWDIDDAGRIALRPAAR